MQLFKIRTLLLGTFGCKYSRNSTYASFIWGRCTTALWEELATWDLSALLLCCLNFQTGEDRFLRKASLTSGAELAWTFNCTAPVLSQQIFSQKQAQVKELASNSLNRSLFVSCCLAWAVKRGTNLLLWVTTIITTLLLREQREWWGFVVSSLL